MHMASFTNLGSTVATAAPALHQSGSSQGQIMSPVEVEDMKAKIMSHPRYSALLAAYLDCQKVGAPPGLLDRLLAVAARLDAYPGQARRRHDLPRDPELDQFMDAYCNMLVRYREELTRPIQEAMEFVKSVERQLNSITVNLRCEGVGSSEDAQDPSGGCGGDVNPTAEDTDQLKYQLLKKYGGCLSGIRQEFSKRKKKGKLPKEARQKLLSWWEQHYKWPYPSETEKMALAEATGLDPKQINNWFINQRKRHWKPSENAADAVTLYMDGQYVVDGVAYRVRP